MSRLAVALVALFAGCTPFSETVGAAAPVGTVWQLESVNDAPVTAPMTLIFLADGGVRGELPCNRYNARQTAPLPWFELTELNVTKRACPELAEETRYVELLTTMDLAEVAGDTMILSNPAEERLLFRSVAGSTS